MTSPSDESHLLERYKYQPLPANAGGSKIRVLRLTCGEDDTKITCSLDTVDLENCPVYDCLSYTWGDPFYHDLSPNPEAIVRHTGNLDRTIECDGKIIYITENLEDALKQLGKTEYISQHVEGRDENSRGYIWIDAICINQNDEAEKAVQIAMMDQVYSKARRVIAWLGKEDEYVPPALDIIERLKSVPLEKRQVRVTGLESPELDALLGEPAIPPQQWLDYAAFIQRSWFNRVWVVQEAFLAKHIDVLCGPHILSWKEDIYDISEFLEESGLAGILIEEVGGTVNPERSTITYSKSSLNNQHNLHLLKAETAENPLSLKYLLNVSRYFEATQAQDHIFGMLGIWKSSQGKKDLPAEMVPDSSRSSDVDFVENNFIRYSLVVISDTKDLSILSLLDDSSTRQHSNLPSWVPDYSVSYHMHPLNGRPNRQKLHWKASGDCVPKQPLHRGSRKLLVDGFLFDTIDEIACTYPEVMDDYNINSLLDILARYPAESYPSGGSIVEAFWRTIIKDVFCERPAGLEAGETLKYLLAPLMDNLEGAASESQDPEQLSRLQGTRATIAAIHSRYKDASIIPDLTTINEVVEALMNMRYDPESTENLKLDRDSNDIDEAFKVAYFYRRLFRTSKNYLGIAPESLQVGDKVWILAGAAVPVILRPVGPEQNAEWNVIGEAYVHGIMEGQALQLLGKEMMGISLV